MTTRADLLETIGNGENSGIEFKRDSIEPRQLAKELVAFSNFEGGSVLLGVENDGTIFGITRENIEEWVMTTCRDKIRPAIIPFYELVKDVDPGKDVAIVRVSRGFDVHGVWHNSGMTYYIRAGTESREATTEELQRLSQRRGGFRVELRPISGAGESDLDRRRLKDYFTRVTQRDVPDDADVDAWHALLLNCEFIVEDGATLAGLVLFGSNPSKFLPHASVDAVAFPGTEMDYAARERISIRGALAPLISGDQLVENGLVEQTVEFIKRNTGVEARLENGTRRVEVPSYPDDVLRETVVNALIHRDYLLSGSNVLVAVYEDRLEVSSPGRLPNGITPARMRTGCRAARNQLLKDVMRDYGYLENLGMGVPRKIIRGMKNHNGTEPELIEDGETFTVRLRRK